MKIEIKSRFSLEVLFSHECENNSVAITLAAAINAKANLRGANLGDADLGVADLYGANLYGANLRGANLRGANLYGANLYGANLVDANLGVADLGDADLGDANLRGANLYGANLGDANLVDANLVDADLGDANLRGANLYGANLYGADLYGAKLGDANLYGANLYGANLYGANLYGANLYGANLYGANLGDAGKLTGDRPYFAVGPIGSRQDVLAAFLTENGVYLRAGCFFGTVEEFRDKLQGEHGDNVHAVEYRAALVLVEAHYNAWPATVVEGATGVAGGSRSGGVMDGAPRVLRPAQWEHLPSTPENSVRDFRSSGGGLDAPELLPAGSMAESMGCVFETTVFRHLMPGVG